MSVDYSIIAKTYDLAHFRAVEEVDGDLLRIAMKHKYVRVLDLACGTGSYIKAQSQFVGNASFIGMDISWAMLSEAMKKGTTSLVMVDVDHGIPLTDGSLDYVACRYGFHHFTNKIFVLEEIKRCLRTNGILSMIDVEPHRNKIWWVYTLFPEIAARDRRRFWKAEKLLGYLKSIGFEVSFRIDTGPETMHKQDLLERLRIRDTSQLHMVDERLYEMKYREVENWPEDRCIEGDYVFLSILGRKHSMNQAKSLNRTRKKPQRTG